MWLDWDDASETLLALHGRNATRMTVSARVDLPNRAPVTIKVGAGSAFSRDISALAAKLQHLQVFNEDTGHIEDKRSWPFAARIELI